MACCDTVTSSRGESVYEDTLPVSGVDGSLSERFRNTPAAGGSMPRRVRSCTYIPLSGYATTQSGQHIAFSVMTNNSNLPAKKALDTIDHIVERLVEDKK